MSTKGNTEWLNIIEEAITDRILLSLSYRSATNGNISERNIEPLALYFTQNRWMMIAYCHLRKAQREFRIDCIVDLKRTEATFPPNQFTLSDYFKG